MIDEGRPLRDPLLAAPRMHALWWLVSAIFDRVIALFAADVRVEFSEEIRADLRRAAVDHRNRFTRWLVRELVAMTLAAVSSRMASRRAAAPPMTVGRWTAETREVALQSMMALSQAIDAKDGFTRGHADRVARIAGAIAREMRLSKADVDIVMVAGLLHDIGKIGVEDRILMKPMRLDADETELMRRHPIYGASILEPSPQLRPVVPLVLHHHENYDGTGYPEGLRGNQIPLGSRILIVADAYEAMTSDRIYRKAIGHERALEMLKKYAGSQFDPSVVQALERRLADLGTDAFEASEVPPINYETLKELRRRLSRQPPRNNY